MLAFNSENTTLDFKRPMYISNLNGSVCSQFVPFIRFEFQWTDFPSEMQCAWCIDSQCSKRCFPTWRLNSVRSSNLFMHEFQMWIIWWVQASWNLIVIKLCDHTNLFHDEMREAPLPALHKHSPTRFGESSVASTALVYFCISSRTSKPRSRKGASKLERWKTQMRWDVFRCLF